MWLNEKAGRVNAIPPSSRRHSINVLKSIRIRGMLNGKKENTMIKLTEVTIHKYKSIESDQTFPIDDKITILVGMNESGKTSVLEAIAKTNYFTEDDTFKYSTTHDYPRKEKKALDKSGEDPQAVTSTYKISQELIDEINNALGENVFSEETFSITTKYSGHRTILGIRGNIDNFIKSILNKDGIYSKSLHEKLSDVKSKNDLETLISEYSEDKYTSALKELQAFFENKYGWDNPISEYIYRNFVEPNIPKYLYYDEYYALPSKISIEELQNEKLEEEELKTAKALFELADINIEELLDADDYEDYKAELEATEAIITDELFKYWTTNNNLDITFDIEKREDTDRSGTKIVEHILNIRVKNTQKRVSLPLKNRSKGFNWFFSFLVWFKRIQEDTSSNYILLLDEPGLNLHASAQNDLLNFIEDLSENYQIIYTTHSPFMINSSKLHRVRTIVETEKGTAISDSIQDKDPNTLFPLQAALGYDIAQNLFISDKNLLVEGASDLIYLQYFSDLLEKNGKEGLHPSITIVPVGGMDKVATFISLLRGSDLDIVCLLDTPNDSKTKAKLDDIIKHKLLSSKNIIYFDEFTQIDKADIEDLFEKEEYLDLFNQSFSEYDDIAIGDLNPDIDRILIQISKIIGKSHFNHFRPAKQLLSNNDYSFSEDTLARFEELFARINTIFSK